MPRLAASSVERARAVLGYMMAHPADDIAAKCRALMPDDCMPLEDYQNALTATYDLGAWSDPVSVLAHIRTRGMLAPAIHELLTWMGMQALADAHTRLDRHVAAARGPRLIAAADLGQPPPVSWLVEGELPERALIALYGRRARAPTPAMTTLRERLEARAALYQLGQRPRQQR